MPDYLII